jgi:hypothetical protein
LSKVSRRFVLRASGVAIGLPWLESLCGASPQATPPGRRLVAINVGLGLHGPNIVPTTSGRDYEMPPYLKLLEDLRNQFTFISGASHPEVGGGHSSGKSYLTGAKNPNSAGFKNSISIDQFAAEQLGTATRFRSLSLSTSGPGLSWSRSGVEIPTEVRPSQVYQQLFLEGKPSERAAQVERLRDGRSVLDAVLERSKRMQNRLGQVDRKKVEQYFDAVREAETRLAKSETWQDKAKPHVDTPPPSDETDRARMIERQRLMYDMMSLAIATDSTRFMTFYATGMNAVPAIRGVDTDYHMLSHHGKDPTKITQLTIVEGELIKLLGEFLRKLADTTEHDGNLLDRTMVMFGSNLGNASSHDTKNMPILLAGGGFEHGQHLAFDANNNYPLPNLYVSMLQRLGLETDGFASATGRMSGLEFK